MTARLDKPAVLLVKHHGPDGLPVRKIVGKTIRHVEHGLVVLHAMSGSQYHYATRCPCPVDTALTVAMGLSKVPFLYAFDRKRERLWRIAPGDIVQHGPTHFYDGRNRFYPAEEHWVYLDGVREEVQSKGIRAYIQDGVPTPLLLAPFLREEIDLGEPGAF